MAQLIGLNAVPGFGFFARDWSPGTLLALYWFENLLGSILIALRIDLHRRLTRMRGHYVSRKASAVKITLGDRKGTRTIVVGRILPSFLLSAVGFTLVEGLFLVAILSQLPERDAVDPGALRSGVGLISAFLAAGFVLDLIGIGSRPFFWIHQLTDRMLARVFVVFLLVFIGIGAIAFFNAPRPVLIAFIGLKTFIDITGALPESQSGEAPQWQLALAGLFGKDARERVAVFARKANRDYGTYQPSDEKPFVAAGAPQA